MTVAGPRTYLRLYSIDALAEPMVSIALIGVPVNGQKLLLRNNGTAQPVDLGPQIVASGVCRLDPSLDGPCVPAYTPHQVPWILQVCCTARHYPKSMYIVVKPNDPFVPARP